MITGLRVQECIDLWAGGAKVKSSRSSVGCTGARLFDPSAEHGAQFVFRCDTGPAGRELRRAGRSRGAARVPDTRGPLRAGQRCARGAAPLGGPRGTHRRPVRSGLIHPEFSPAPGALRPGGGAHPRSNRGLDDRRADTGIDLETGEFARTALQLCNRLRLRPASAGRRSALETSSSKRTFVAGAARSGASTTPVNASDSAAAGSSCDPRKLRPGS